MTDVPAFDDDHWFGPDVRRTPEMEAVWTWLVDQDAGLPNWLDLPPAEARRLHDGMTRRWNAILPDVASVEPVLVPGAVPVAGQMIVPHAAEPGCIVFLHGGGWAFGSLETHQRFMRLLARAAKRRVLGVDYRLAVSHPYPAPLDDCRAAWDWLAAQARTDPTFAGPLTIAGDSAGANLALGVMLDAAERGQPMPAASLLFYGAYDAAADGPSYRRFGEGFGLTAAAMRRFGEGFGLTAAAMRRFWQLYAPDPAHHDDPLVSALRAPDRLLRLLPPLYLNAAGLDPLLSDSLAMVKRLGLAGVRHAFVVHGGVHHGFMQMSLRLPEAQRAIDRAADFLRTTV